MRVAAAAVCVFLAALRVAAAPCSPSDTVLCLDDVPGDRRFRIEIAFASAQGGGLSGSGHAVPLASLGVGSGGLFWFFSPSNPEVLVKLLDGCAVNGHRWLFASAGTNVGLTLTVTDTTTGAVRAYTNPDRTPASPVQDTAAFACVAPKAFPGAEGFGAVATGGRGGRVLYVTNLLPSGPGSLQDALDQTGPRTVLFKVSGLLDAPVHLTRGDVTIAGQTSPGGITLRQLHTTEEPFCEADPGCILQPATRHAENWILRHVRLRPGADGPDDGLRIRYSRRAIVDHCSIANATDEAVEISFSSDVTVQRSIVAETLGDHAPFGGMLMNYANAAAGFPLDRISVHHVLFSRLLGRLPELSRESPGAGGTFLDLELSSNLYWDPGYFVDVNQTTVSGSAEGEPISYRMNAVGNVAVARPGHPYGWMSLPLNTPNATTTYLDGNRLSLYPSRRDYQLLYCCNDYPTTIADPSQLPYPDPASPPPFARSSRHPFPEVTYTPPDALADEIYRTAGAFPRDPMDRRLTARLLDGSFDPAPRDANPYGDAHAFDFPAGSAPAPPADTDADGMPDAFELAHGLDPAVPEHNGTSLSVPLLGVPGYTNLEVYLHLLSLERTVVPAPRAGR